MNRRRTFVLVTLSICVLIAAAIFIARAPIRNAARIQPGDSTNDVHEALGKPDAIFITTDDLQSSRLLPMSYSFTDRSGRSGISADELPAVNVRAEWFGYASAGHLVYYDDKGVTEVFWGGT